MAHTRTWNASYEGDPANGDDALEGAARIRELKQDIRERMELDHNMDETNNDGLHTKVTLMEHGANPSTVADTAILFSKDSNGLTMPFVKNSNGDVAPVNLIMPFTQGYLTPATFLTGVYASAATAVFTALKVYVEGSSGVGVILSNFNKTANITVSGAGGLDTGVEAASTWYHVWAIAKADGTQNILLSTSAGSPTLPAGYVFKGYIGAIYNDASSNFRTFTQRGNVVHHPALTCLSAGTATSDTSLNSVSGTIINKLDTIVPSTAEIVMGYAGPKDTASGVSILTITPQNGSSEGQLEFRNHGGTTSTARWPFEIMMVTNQLLFYSVSGATDEGDIIISGFKF